MLKADGRIFTSGNRSLQAVVEEGEAMPGERFTKSREDADEVILHIAKAELKAAGWTIEEGLTLTGADGRTYRVTRTFPDHSTPIQRLRCAVS